MDSSQNTINKQTNKQTKRKTFNEKKTVGVILMPSRYKFGHVILDDTAHHKMFSYRAKNSIRHFLWLPHYSPHRLLYNHRFLKS